MLANIIFWNDSRYNFQTCRRWYFPQMVFNDAREIFTILLTIFSRMLANIVFQNVSGYKFKNASEYKFQKW